MNAIKLLLVCIIICLGWILRAIKPDFPFLAISMIGFFAGAVVGWTWNKDGD